MASSKVMPSSTSPNSDLARQSSTYSLSIGDLQGDQSKNFGSMNMDEFIKNIYGDNSTPEIMSEANNGGGESKVIPIGGEISSSRQGSFSIPKNSSNRTAEEVWKDITRNGDRERIGRERGREEEEKKSFVEMTLEDYLNSHGAMEIEDVKIPNVIGPVTGFVIDSPFDGRFLPPNPPRQQQQQQQQIEGTILGFGNGMEGRGGGAGRGKRRAIQEPTDKVAQQRQRRMIKNRESAARSRERKQAYTEELESSVARLEEEHARLLKEKEERKRARYNQLMEILIPVEEKQKSSRVLRRFGSAEW